VLYAGTGLSVHVQLKALFVQLGCSPQCCCAAVLSSAGSCLVLYAGTGFFGAALFGHNTPLYEFKQLLTFTTVLL
jgi:hypothetical protein